MKRLLLFLFMVVAGLLGTTSTASAASCSNTTVGTFTCIQSTAGSAQTNAAPTLAMPSNLTSGSILVGGVAWDHSGGKTLNSITASSGCTGITVTLLDNPTGSITGAAGFYATGYSSGACTLQFNFSATTSSGYAVHEISGQDTGTPVGTRHAAAEFQGVTSADVATGSVTASGTDYIFGFFGESADVFSPAKAPASAGAGYTIRESGASANAGSWGTEDKAASGSNAVHFTTSAATNYGVVVLIDVAPAAGGGATVAPKLLLLGVGSEGR